MCSVATLTRFVLTLFFQFQNTRSFYVTMLTFDFVLFYDIIHSFGKFKIGIGLECPKPSY